MICARYVEPDRRHLVVVDNSVSVRGMCPREYPTLVTADEAWEADLNANGMVCKNAAGDAFTDDDH